MAATCPMCRYTVQIGPDNPGGKKYKSYSGDRILVDAEFEEVDDDKKSG